MAIISKKIALSVWGAIAFCLLPLSSQATDIEMVVISGYQQIEVFRKSAPREFAHTSFVGIAAGAYRAVGERTYWGAVIELTEPFSRDNSIGSGRIIALRPINFMYAWSPRMATEAYFGMAQYDWIDKASGYYFGANARYRLGKNDRFSLLFDAKYYSDLAHDAGPGGDQVVSGASFGLGFLYRFPD